MKLIFQFLLTSTCLATFSASLAHTVHDPPAAVGRKGPILPEFQLLIDGNKVFRDELVEHSPMLLQTLADEGQAPPFMLIGCSDSRVAEGTIFSAKPGTFFTERNIANQFFATDPNIHAVVSYGVAVLDVKHVIIMGHYGCGGVAAAIGPRPNRSTDAANHAVHAWIEPIREIFRTSSRPEIAHLREKVQGQTYTEEPHIQDPGFRALVEENVKAGVKRIATDSVVADYYATPNPASAPSNITSVPPTHTKATDHSPSTHDIYIHGWVYDIETGIVNDLGVSVGPPGKPIPAAPWEAVKSAVTASSRGGVHSK